MPKFMTLTRMIYPMFATGEATTVSATEWAEVISSVTAQFSVTTIVAVITSIVVAGIGFVFLWWGVRKAFKSIMSAVKKGRIKF